MIERDVVLRENDLVAGEAVRTRVVFAGEYDLAVKEQLREELDRLVDEPAVVLDFSDVSYIDSTCVGRIDEAPRPARRPRLAVTDDSHETRQSDSSHLRDLGVAVGIRFRRGTAAFRNDGRSCFRKRNRRTDPDISRVSASKS
jgi:STAS domain